LAFEAHERFFRSGIMIDVYGTLRRSTPTPK
jgi:hypothetical protein